MTQEEKQLLLKDLFARLPYGLKFQSYHSECGIEGKGTFDFEIGDDVTLSMLKHWCETDNNKPYLRPMSSMTEDEEDELNSATMGNYGEDVDWLLSHHFDYRIDPSTGKTLIESGLALEAPKGMYKIE